MKATPLTLDEVDDFYALNIPIEAAHMPREAVARAIAEHRVQCAASSSSMGTAETFWYALRSTAPPEAATGGVVVPPGQQPEDWPYEQWADDRDVDGLLWAPLRARQRACLVGAMPEARAPIATAECTRILAALDARFRKQPRARDPSPSFEKALGAVMRRIDDFSSETLDQRVLRFEVLRTMVKIAWDRPWQPVDVKAAWWD